MRNWVREVEAAVPILLVVFAIPPAALAENGSLKLTSFPSGAQVWVDGIYTGRVTPMRIRLSVGEHTVTVQPPGSGWRAETRVVTIVRGDNQLRLTLLPLVTQGPPGSAGADGAIGPIGPQGPKGDRGDKGDQGESGSTGPMGPQGPAGPSLTSIHSLDGLQCAAGGNVGTISLTFDALGTAILKCVSTPTAPALVASNLGRVCDVEVTADLVVTSGTLQINTGGGQQQGDCDAVVENGGGRQICVKKCQNLSIATGAGVTVTGERPLALVATAAVFVDGVVDASAKGIVPGPGGSSFGSGEGRPDGPGGGAGYGSAGGSFRFAGFPTSSGGTPYGSADLVPLRAGSSGEGWPHGFGGAGGGAIQLVSCGWMTIGSHGVITAGGGGGQGSALTGPPEAGAGGGSGGAILLEAMAIDISGTLAANGGGGGAAGASTFGNGHDGQPSGGPAPGGSGPMPGGSGGAAGSPAQSTTNGGGAGGGFGRIRINVPAGVTPVLASPILSPQPTIGTVAVN